MTGNPPEYAIITDVSVPVDADIYDQVNLYNCEIGSGTKIDSFVYIEEDVTIGQDCIIRPFTFIPTGVTLEDEVFVGPNVTFSNDMYPSVNGDWELLKTVVRKGAAIGAGVTVAPGVEIGTRALIGAGAVVLDDVPPEVTVVGNPAEIIN